MATSAKAPISPEEYLDRERKAEFRSEYFRGQIIAMAGHGRIVTNLVREFGHQLRQRDCNVYSSDLRVSVSQAGLYAYPDVVVTCGEEKFLDATLDTLLTPAVIVEVLSESTKKYDRGQKFESYRAAASLSEYLTVAQDKMHVEHYRREPDGGWSLNEHTDAGSRMRLESVGVELQLSDLYEKVEFA
jgi:Uma2 family endonuclease